MHMAKREQDSEAVKVTMQEFFYPPQDGREAFVCEAQSQEEADAKYAAALKN